MKICVYTAIYGNYDVLRQHSTQTLPCDYKLFTDNPQFPTPEGITRIVRSEPGLSPVLQNVKIRLFPFEIPELEPYDLLIYIDGNVMLKDPEFLNWLVNQMNGKEDFDLIISKHAIATSVKQEVDTSKLSTKYSGTDLDGQLSRYQSEGFPDTLGMFWNGFLVYNRKCNRERLDRFSKLWWNEMVAYGGHPQGQVSFPYCLWKIPLDLIVIPPLYYSPMLDLNGLLYYPILLHHRDDAEKITDPQRRYQSSMGLANQLFTLVIEISKAASRRLYHIVIDSFMTDINKGTTRRISEVIDLEKTQEEIRKIPGLEFVTLLDRSLLSFDTSNLFRGFNRPNDSWFNHPFPEMMPELLRAIVYVPVLNRIADSIGASANQTNLSVIHLRIEDDIIDHVSKRITVDRDYVKSALSRKFKQAIQEHLLENSDLLVCGSEERLGLEDYIFHQFNQEKKILLDLEYGDSGRELCAILDYLLSKRAENVWIGTCHPKQNTGSSFSYYLLVSAKRRKNVYIDLYCLYHPLTIELTSKSLEVPFRILSAHTGHGTVGLNGALGYFTEDGPDVKIDENVFSLSAHGPSRVVIEVTRPVIIRGYASPTAKKCPLISFYVDERLIGFVNEAGMKSNSLAVKPGIYLLTIISDPTWCHSVWIFNNQTE